MIEEVIYVSAFNVKPNGTIEVRKTTDVVKDGATIASSFWRCVLQPHDPSADEVLGEGYYRDLATAAWASFPIPEPVIVEEPVVEPVAEEPAVEPTAETQPTAEGELSL